MLDPPAALNESITDLKEDLEDERGETNKMKSTYTKLEEEISALLSQQKQQQQQEKTASGSKGRANHVWRSALNLPVAPEEEIERKRHGDLSF